MGKDHYEILGITRNASEAEIRTAYRRLALKYHPDKNKTPDAAQNFRQVTDAYNVLGDKERREVYDRIFKDGDSKRNASGGGTQSKHDSSARSKRQANKNTSFGFGAGGFGPGGTNTTFAAPPGRAQNAPFAFGSSTSSERANSGDTPFEEWSSRAQHSPFGFGSSRSSGRANTSYTPFEEWSSRAQHAPFWFASSTSSGKRANTGDTPFAQNAPFGFGTPSGGGIFGATSFARQSTEYRYGPGFSAPYSPSPDNNPKSSTNGRTPDSTQKPKMKQNPPVEHDVYVTLYEVLRGCTKKMKITRTVMSLDGRTSKREEKILEINVKPGWKEGTKITFHREGDQIPGTIPADIVFIIRDEPHPVFKREGANIHYTARITADEAEYGRVIRVPTLTGGNITIPLNENVFTGVVMSFPSHGLPRPKDPTSRGDLVLNFDIECRDFWRESYSREFWDDLRYPF